MAAQGMHRFHGQKAPAPPTGKRDQERGHPLSFRIHDASLDVTDRRSLIEGEDRKPGEVLRSHASAPSNREGINVYILCEEAPIKPKPSFDIGGVLTLT